ncbi:hypothetical protein [Methylopila sp. 73B]|uniref:hypothetical protein n=1 Tax=Methylopila sp. 73B TaxID=1120792 RepID=UPI0012DE95ED|nr:hypothetical protein [Methylopila sp. 73B]
MEQGSFLTLLEPPGPPPVSPFERLKEDNLDRSAIRERLLCFNKGKTTMFEMKQAHGGQKRAYGDSYYEYEIKSDLGANETLAKALFEVREKWSRIAISEAEYRRLDRLKSDDPEYDFGNHFRPYYKIANIGDNSYQLTIITAYTD